MGNLTKQIVIDIKEDLRELKETIRFIRPCITLEDYLGDLLHLTIRARTAIKPIFKRNPLIPEQETEDFTPYYTVDEYINSFSSNSIIDLFNLVPIKLKLNYYTELILPYLEEDHLYTIYIEDVSIIVKDLGNIYKIRFKEALEYTTDIKPFEGVHPWK